MRRIDVPFAQVARDVLNNKKLSLKAKGLYAYLYGKPSEWHFAADRIAHEIKESRPTILEILKELETIGLLKRAKRHDGRIEYILFTTVKEFDCGIEKRLELPSVKESHRGNSSPSKSLTHNIEISLDRDSNKKERESPDKPENHLSYLKEIPKEDVKEFIEDYKVTEEGLKAKASDLLDWCEANGKRKKNYKAFLRVAVKKDFGKRTPQDKILDERIRLTKQGQSSPFAKSLAAKMKM